jgi:hypothetical protein
MAFRATRYADEGGGRRSDSGSRLLRGGRAQGAVRQVPGHVETYAAHRADRLRRRALITLKLAAGEVPVHPPETAGERLVEYLLRKEAESEAGAKGA